MPLKEKAMTYTEHLLSEVFIILEIRFKRECERNSSIHYFGD